MKLTIIEYFLITNQVKLNYNYELNYRIWISAKDLLSNIAGRFCIVTKTYYLISKQYCLADSLQILAKDLLSNIA